MARKPAGRPHPAATPNKLFVLDTNVLMHDPSSVYRFEEHEGGTRATYVSTFANADDLQVVLDMGVVEGATAATNQIDGLLAVA